MVLAILRSYLTSDVTTTGSYVTVVFCSNGRYNRVELGAVIPELERMFYYVLCECSV